MGAKKVTRHSLAMTSTGESRREKKPPPLRKVSKQPTEAQRQAPSSKRPPPQGKGRTKGTNEAHGQMLFSSSSLLLPSPSLLPSEPVGVGLGEWLSDASKGAAKGLATVFLGLKGDGEPPSWKEDDENGTAPKGPSGVWFDDEPPKAKTPREAFNAIKRATWANPSLLGSPDAIDFLFRASPRDFRRVFGSEQYSKAFTKLGDIRTKASSRVVDIGSFKFDRPVSATLQPLLSYLEVPLDLAKVGNGKTYGFLSLHSTPVRRVVYLTVNQPEHLPQLTKLLLPLLSVPGVQGIFAGGFPGLTTGNVRVALGGNTDKRISEIENMLLEKVGEHSEYLGTLVPPGTTVVDSGIGRAPSPWVWAAPQFPGDDLFWVLSRILHHANQEVGRTPGADESSFNKSVELGLDNAGIREDLTELLPPKDWPVPATPQVLRYMLATQEIEIIEDRARRYAKIQKALENLSLDIRLGDASAAKEANRLWFEFVTQERALRSISRGKAEPHSSR